MRSPAASALSLPEGPPRRGDEQAPIHCPAEGHAGLSMQAAPHCASGTKAALPRPAGIGSVSAADGWTPEVLGAGCGTVLGRACIAASVGRPSDRQRRLHCTSIDPAVRTAAGCGPSQRLRLLARGSGKYLTPAEVLGLLTSEAPVCGRYIRMHCIAPLRQTQLQ